MKIQHINNHTESNSTGVVATMAINEQTSHKLIVGLIEGLYSDKTRYIAELTANAFDEKASRLPDIHIPTKEDPNFRVRDYGRGMNHEFMMTKYTIVGYSTKDDDNDAIGGWGLGRLTGLAVCSAYAVTTFIDGTYRIYRVFRGKNRVPALQFVEEGHTDQPNGTLVEIPIDPSEVEHTQTSAAKLLEFYNPQPNYVGFKIQPVEYHFFGSFWRQRKGRYEPIVLMGGYPYPVTRYNISNNTPTTDMLFAAKSSFVIEAPIGSLDITMNREGLEYTKKTNAKLKELAEEVAKEIVPHYQKEFDDITSEYEIKLKFHEIVEGGDYNLRLLLSKSLTWNGDKINDSYIRPDKLQVHKIRYQDLTDRRRNWTDLPSRLMFKDGSVIPARDNTRIYVKGDIKGFNGRILNDPDLKPKDKVVLVDTVADLALIGNPTKYTMVADLPEPPKVSRTASVKKPVKLKYWGGYSWNETEFIDGVPDGSIYVDINGTTEENSKLWIKFSRCLPENTTVYGLNRTVKGVDRDKLIHFDAWVEAQAKAITFEEQVQAWSENFYEQLGHPLLNLLSRLRDFRHFFPKYVETQHLVNHPFFKMEGTKTAEFRKKCVVLDLIKSCRAETKARKLCEFDENTVPEVIVRVSDMRRNCRYNQYEEFDKMLETYLPTVLTPVTS